MTPTLRLTRRALAAMVWCLAALSTTGAQEHATAPSSVPPPVRIDAVTARNGMVVAQEKRASRIGVEILEKGGNAIDAAVAVGFALAVTLPKAGNLGGGGFMLMHLAQPNEDVAIDYREAAPRDTPPDVFLDPNGEADPKKSRESGLGVGVPGTVAGLAVALDRFGSGKFTLADLIAPALALARDGVPVEDDLVDSLLLAQPRLARWPSSARVFLKPDGTPPGPGEQLVQGDLAASLEAIARDGARAFYTGPIADQIVAAVREAGGRMTRRDLEAYAPMLREPAHGTYRGYDIVSMPPPSSGGLTIIQMLEMLERFPIGDNSQGFGFGQKNTLHVMIEAMRLAFADRAFWEGDEDFVHVPKKGLLDATYLASRSALIDLNTVLPPTTHGNPLPFDMASLTSQKVKLAAVAPQREGTHTTHFVVVDKHNNIVSYTTTVESLFGSGITVPGYGFILNNELTDFNFPPAFNPATGNPGANDVAPFKRPRSSMAPTLLLKDDEPFAVMGAAGGATIINSLLQITFNIVDHGMTIQQAIDAPRISSTHRSSVSCETGPFFPLGFTPTPPFSATVVQALRAMGHDIPPCSANIATGASSSAQAVIIDLQTGKQYGAADPRREGTVIGLPATRQGG